jgi:hypothetical protein
VFIEANLAGNRSLAVKPAEPAMLSSTTKPGFWVNGESVDEIADAVILLSEISIKDYN